MTLQYHNEMNVANRKCAERAEDEAKKTGKYVHKIYDKLINDNDRQ